MLKTLTAKEVSYNAIFFSAFKAMAIFELLLEAPRTLDEIQEFLKSIPFINANLTKDTIRIYINTFQKAGCKVQKNLTQKRHREYTYFIPQNPFYPAMNKKQTKRFFEIFDILLYNLPFPEVIELETFTRVLEKNFDNDFFTTTYEAHSPLKEFDLDLLKELQKCCENNDIVTVLYKSPRSNLKKISILAKQIKIQSYKLYLQGFGFEYKEDNIFLISRIVKIVDVIPKTEVTIPLEADKTHIICEFYNPDIPLLENEILLKETNKKRLIQHSMSNKLLSNQRFLQLADQCKILEPLSFQKEFIKLLKTTEKGYLNAR